MSEPIILGFGSNNPVRVESILYVLGLVMIFRFRLVIGNDDRTLYIVLEQLRNIPIKPGAYLDYYSRKRRLTLFVLRIGMAVYRDAIVEAYKYKPRS
jgi:hypothetical protein